MRLPAPPTTSAPASPADAPSTSASPTSGTSTSASSTSCTPLFTAPLLLAGTLVRQRGWRIVDETGRVWQLGQIDPDVIRALHQCTGHVSATRLADELPDPAREEFLSLVSTLAQVGLVHPVAALNRIAVIGSGRLARALCRHLCALGPTRLVLTDVSPPDPLLYPRHVATTGAMALRQWLRTRVDVSHELSVGSHWAELTVEHADVAVIATPTVVPDRAITDQLIRAGLPHLVVSQHRQTAHVGPLVRPGQGPCLCCDDIVRAAGDPLWPATVATMARTAATGDPRLVEWAAQHAAMLLSGDWSGADTGRVWSASTTVGIRSREWPAHPDCPCQGRRTLGAA